MSGAVKSGLIFALVGILSLVVSTIVPAILHPALGLCLCGPLVVILNGTGAGYLGVRWSKEDAGVGQGVLAGAIAGIGVLLGTVALFVALLLFIRNIAQSDPELYEQVLREAMRQQPDVNLDPAALNQMMNWMLPGVGFCLGLLNLSLSLGLGALGGWLAVRYRPGPGATPMIQTPLGPPPLDPPS
jgi:hypothetical protein